MYHTVNYRMKTVTVGNIIKARYSVLQLSLQFWIKCFLQLPWKRSWKIFLLDESEICQLAKGLDLCVTGEMPQNDWILRKPFKKKKKKGHKQDGHFKQESLGLQKNDVCDICERRLMNQPINKKRTAFNMTCTETSSGTTLGSLGRKGRDESDAKGREWRWQRQGVKREKSVSVGCKQQRNKDIHSSWGGNVRADAVEDEAVSLSFPLLLVWLVSCSSALIDTKTP